MTPVPIELPVRPSEASAVADLLFQSAEGRALTDDLRTRLAGRVSTLGLTSLRAHFGSLEADPVHASTYYLAADGLMGEVPQPLLLHMAPASAPASSLFPGSLLIGRMRPGGGREILINCAPFGPRDTRNIAVYAESMGRVFLPRPQGALPALTVRLSEFEISGAAAFQAYRTHMKSRGLNLASFEAGPQAEDFYGIVWAAVRAGWREGYSIGVHDDSETVALASRVIIEETEAGRFAERLRRAREARQGRAADIELRLPAEFGAQACGDLLDDLRELNCLPHLVSFNGQPAESLIEAVHEGGVRLNPVVNVEPPAGESPEEARKAVAARILEAAERGR